MQLIRFEDKVQRSLTYCERLQEAWTFFTEACCRKRWLKRWLECWTGIQDQKHDYVKKKKNVGNIFWQLDIEHGNKRSAADL